MMHLTPYPEATMMLLRSVVILSTLWLLACVPFAQAQIELRFGHDSSTTDYAHYAAEVFKKHIEEASGGEIKVNLFPGGQLGKSGDLIQGVRLGSIDVTAIGNPFFTGFNPIMNVLDLPFLFRDHPHVYRVLDGEVGRKVLASLEKHSIKGLTFWEIGFRNMTNNVRPVRLPSDLKGLKLRTTPNQAHIRAFQLLGANPTPMAFQDVYMGLQTNAIDGQENPVNVIYAMRFNEVQKYLSLTQHAYPAMILAMNLNKFNALSPRHQRIVQEASLAAARFQRDGLAKQNAERLAALKAAGLQVIEEIDREPFRRIVYEPVKAEFEKVHGTELTRAILAQ
jgi:tripartite ATP-independent transporter DctP family solute receptor